MTFPVPPAPQYRTAAPVTVAPLTAGRRLGRAAAALPLLLTLGACNEFERFMLRPEPGAATAAAEPRATAEPAPTTAAAPAPEPDPDPIPKPQEKPKPGKLYEWDGQGHKLTRIVIDTDEQKARFYVDEDQVGWTTVATGLKTHPTPVGHFEVMEKSVDKRSNLYGKVLGRGGRVISGNAKAGEGRFPTGSRFEGASMPYYLRLTYDGVGLHAGPIPRPGRPASHGCIRLPAKLAPVLFEHVDLGTKVSIVGSGPDYGNYAAKQRAYAAEQRALAEERRAAAERARAAAANARPIATPAAATGTAPGVTAAIANSPPPPRPEASTLALAEPSAGQVPSAAPALPRAVETPARPDPAGALAPPPTAAPAAPVDTATPAEITPPPPTAVPPAPTRAQGAAQAPTAPTGAPPRVAAEPAGPAEAPASSSGG